MTGRRATLLLFLALLTALPACSAVVSPDPARLRGADAALGSDVPPATGCGPGLVSCGGRCVDPSTDPSACGGCGTACAAGATCVSGACVCPPGVTGCATTTPALGDPADCGPSHARCATAQLCVRGACVCRPPLELVAGVCVDLGNDPENCGMAGVRCPDVCGAGTCRSACSDPLRECDGACVELRTDPLHCGECGRICSGSEACVNGDCREVTPATGCAGCPCAACGGDPCCVLPRFDVPFCVNADVCPR